MALELAVNSLPTKRRRDGREDIVKTYGVVLAGGVGARLGLAVPKQMLKVAGKTILEHTVAVFQAASDIDDILVVVTPGWVGRVTQLLGRRYGKLTQVLEGGATRNESTRRALDALPGGQAKIVLHDAVRPLLDQRILRDCVRALDEFDAVDVVIPSADTIVRVDDDDIITAIPDRSTLRRGQTPQAFKLPVLRRAYEAALGDPSFKASDDCGLVVKYCPEVRIKCVRGAEHNVKVTHAVDLFIADKLFQLSSGTVSDDEGAALEALADKVVVVLGGAYGIGAEIVRAAKAAGATVVAHSRSSSGLNVANAAAVTAALAQAAAEHGRIDAVVLTAGVLRIGPLVKATDAQVAESIAVNYGAPVTVARAAYPYLKASKGHLVLFTSSSYTRGREHYSLYSSAKAAVVNLTQALADEWGDDGIRVNVISPERTDTPMRRRAFGVEPPGTLLRPERVAETVLSVISNDMTGAVVDVRREGSALVSLARESCLEEV